LAVLHDNVQVVLEVVADHLVDTNNVVVANLLHGSDLITHIFIHEAVGSMSMSFFFTKVFFFVFLRRVFTANSLDTPSQVFSARNTSP
jgi:hypothetical protein